MKMLLAIFDVSDAVMKLFIGLASTVYSVLEKLSQLFFDVSVVQLLDDASISAIYQRVGLILGLFMLFKLTFSFIQMIVDPDQITDKEKGIGSIIKKILVVILLLGMTPIIFKTGFAFQEAIIKDNTIGRIILGDEASNTSELGKIFTVNLYASFADESKRKEFTDGLLANNGLNYSDMDDYIMLNHGSGVGNAFFCLLVGCFALWMFLMYTISTGLRVVQLMFLELISPVPIISYLSSKKETGLQTWIKQCITTFLDLFIRMAILYFSVLLLHIIVTNNTSTMISSSVGDTSSNTLIKIILVLGVLLFMKKAPQLIEELFPGLKTKASGDFGLGLKSRTDMPGLARRAIGGLLGAPIGGVGNAAVRAVGRMANNMQNKKPLTEGLGKAFGTGLVAGAGRGFVGGVAAKSGFMGGFNKDARARMLGGNARFLNNEENGYTTAERMQDYFAQKLGFPSYVQKLKNDKVGYDAAKSGVKMLETYHDLCVKEADDKLETGEFMRPEFNTKEGLRVYRAGIEATRLKNLAASYTDQNSAIYKDYQQKLASIQNDNNLTEAQKEEQKREVSEKFTREQMRASYEADEAKKAFRREYVTFTTGDNAGAATNHRLKSEKELTQQKIRNHNDAYKSVPDAQIEFQLTNDFKDLDDWKKGKGEYADDGPKRGGRQIVQDAEAHLQKIDFEIKEREEKMNGNKASGSK